MQVRCLLLLSWLVLGFAERCVFPSRKGKHWILECVKYSHQSGWWCPTTANYGRDRARAFCNPKLEQECVFPSRYQGHMITACIEGSGPKKDGRGWCPTTANYDADPSGWTFCPPKLSYKMEFSTLQILFMVVAPIMIVTVLVVIAISVGRERHRRQRGSLEKAPVLPNNLNSNPSNSLGGTETSRIYDPQTTLHKPNATAPPGKFTVSLVNESS